MRSQSSQAIHALLLQLYRVSHEAAIGDFQDEVLGLLKDLIPFDTAMWQTRTAHSEGFVTQAIHLHHEPAEMVLEYEGLEQYDLASRSVFVAPGGTRRFHAPTEFGGAEQREFLEFLQRFEHRNVLITASRSAGTRSAQWISLYRASADQHCSEEERLLLGVLAPHVMQALDFNRIGHMKLVAGPASHKACAIADVRGGICHGESAFTAQLMQEWPDWNGAALPAAVLDCFRSGSHQYRGSRVVVSYRHEHGLLFLNSRKATKADLLSARESQVAAMLAKGLTHKQIAQVADRSPATVRNQIRSIYEKLEVANVAELIHELQASEP